MITAGVDVGSTAAKAVLLKGRQILSQAMIPTGWSPGRAGKDVLQQALAKANVKASEVKKIVGTGYGRVALNFIDQAVTEITCHALGANYYYPENSMVIDIGGQDSKVMLVNKKGKVLNFVMNDKCAAGTGRFLQVTVNGLGLELAELDELPAAEPINLSSMCTVFAESEVISLLAAGAAKERIVAGLFKSIAKRIAAMAGTMQIPARVTFTGGVAQSRQLREMLAKELQTEIDVPPYPQFTGALGAAIAAQR